MISDISIQILEYLCPKSLGNPKPRAFAPASLPAACAIAHAIAHRFSAVGVFDPKLNGYVVAVTHDPEVELGSIIAA